MQATDSPETEVGEQAKPQSQGFTLGRALSLLLAVGITAAVFAFGRQLARFATYGYLGVFLITLVGNATIILPVPGLLAVYAGGAVLNPFMVSLVAGVGQSLGELTGYLAGYGGGGVIENRAYYAKVQGWMQRRGFVTIVVLAAIPNPVFDVAGICAGALHMPVSKFLLACWLGKTAKALAVALLGLASVRWLGPLLQSLR